MHGIDGTTKLVSLTGTKTRSQRWKIGVIQIFQVVVKLEKAVDNLWDPKQWDPNWLPKHPKMLVRLAKETFNSTATATQEKEIEGIHVWEVKYQAGSTPWAHLIGCCHISLMK